MEPIILATAAAVSTVLILATAAVIIVRLTITGTASPHRASVLNSIAQIILAIRGKK